MILRELVRMEVCAFGAVSVLAAQLLLISMEWVLEVAALFIEQEDVLRTHISNRSTCEYGDQHNKVYTMRSAAGWGRRPLIAHPHVPVR